MCASPTGWTASSNSNGEGGQRKVRLPGEHGISRPAIAQGRPSDRRHLYAAVRFFLRVHFAQRTAGACRHPAFPAPSWIWGRSDQAKLGRNAPRERKGASASEMVRKERCPCVKLRHCSIASAATCPPKPGPILAACRAASGSWLCAHRLRAAACPGHGDLPPTRSAPLTIFWRCSCCHFSSRNDLTGPPGNQPSTVLAEDLWAQKGLAMLIRGQIEGISGEVALTAATIPAALLPTLLIGGLLLSCP